MTIDSQVRRVYRLLKRDDLKVVFAESCTGGLVSGALTKLPGISNYHCGGLVVYRNETKTAYLDIPPRVLKNPGPVSRQVAQLMAQGVLEKTPEADVSAAVTGHLGPDAPASLDGRVFVAVAMRRGKGQSPRVAIEQLSCRHLSTRLKRQRWVTEAVLTMLADELEKGGG